MLAFEHASWRYRTGMAKTRMQAAFYSDRLALTYGFQRVEMENLTERHRCKQKKIPANLRPVGKQL